MSEKIINLNDMSACKDKADLKTINERMAGGPKGTKVTFINHDTGEVLGEYHNKVVITGSIHNASAAWGIDEVPVILPSYNSEMNLDQSKAPGSPKLHPSTICLFCVGDDGCGSTQKDVKTTSYIDRIKPITRNITAPTDFSRDEIYPFRFVDSSNDLNPDLRKYYFGRKSFPEINKVGYFFKTFDTDPQIHLRYADGTQITENIYKYETQQSCECYVETRLRITRLDFRDFFEYAIGWENARISSLSLCHAWYDDESGDYKIYNDIFPYSKLNFCYEWLVDATKSLDIIYDVYY